MATSTYKPYDLKDFRQVKDKDQSIKLGGLGANIGSDDWERAQKKKEQAQSYAEIVRNTMKPAAPKQPRLPKPKEMSSRDKAIEFAKHNVPKPRLAQPKDDKRAGTQDEQELAAEENLMLGENDEQRRELEVLDAKNKMYAGELAKIK